MHIFKVCFQRSIHKIKEIICSIENKNTFKFSLSIAVTEAGVKN